MDSRSVELIFVLQNDLATAKDTVKPDLIRVAAVSA
jgi:hypothetical protein